MTPYQTTNGRPYEEFVKGTLLAPIGITRMRIGHSRPEGRAPGEVAYTDYRDAPLAPSVFERFRSVARPTGGFHLLEAMDSHGGWLASASDLVRFVSHVDGIRKSALLSPVLAMEMLQPPPFTSARDATFYGLGWNVRRLGSGRLNFWHRGGLPGTASLLVRTSEGYAWALVVNSQPRDSQGFNQEMDRALWQAARDVTHWPPHDLF